MKLYTYRAGGADRLAVGYASAPDMLYPLEGYGLAFSDMTDLIRRLTPADRARLQTPTGTPLPYDAVCHRAPIPCPAQDIICLGINYRAHAAESERFDAAAFGGERPHAIYFSKRVNEATGDGGVIPAHTGLVSSLDYEVELAVILGRDVKDIAPTDVPACIFGYTILNDVSARDLQTGHKQWYFGKSLDGFTPMGPCILTADEVPFPPALPISCTVNGELRQASCTDRLIFGIDEIISELSRGMTLRAGTILATGTPAGVGMGMQPPRFLQAGDQVCCAIEGIGTLTSTVQNRSEQEG